MEEKTNPTQEVMSQEHEDFGFEPLSNYIVLDISEPTEEKVGNIIIPKTVKRIVFKGTVVAVSKEKDYQGNPFVKNVKVGDVVLFDINDTGSAIQVGNNEYTIMRESSLFGILTGKGGAVARQMQKGGGSGLITPKHIN